MCHLEMETEVMKMALVELMYLITRLEMENLIISESRVDKISSQDIMILKKKKESILFMLHQTVIDKLFA